VTVTNNSGLDSSGLSSLVNSFQQTGSQQLSALSDLFKSQQSQIGSLAESQQTEGDAPRNRQVVIVVVAVLALVALFIWKGRK
jgi:hypothetical protein